MVEAVNVGLAVRVRERVGLAERVPVLQLWLRTETVRLGDADGERVEVGVQYRERVVLRDREGSVAVRRRVLVALQVHVGLGLGLRLPVGEAVRPRVVDSVTVRTGDAVGVTDRVPVRLWLAEAEAEAVREGTTVAVADAVADRLPPVWVSLVCVCVKVGLAGLAEK